MKANITKQIVIWGVYLAIFSIFGFTFLGYPKIWAVSLTLMPILVIIISLHLGISGLTFGFIFFGLSSFLSAWTIGDPLATLIINNYGVGHLFVIAFVSRFLLGILIGLIYFLIRKTHFVFKLGFVTFGILIGNTFFFLGALTLYNVSQYLLPSRENISLWIWFTLVVPNIIAEWIILPIICFSISPLIIYLRKNINQKYGW